MIILFILVINLISFCIMGWDKKCAINNNYRISEKEIFIISILGGSIGTLIGMKIFHHKTQKKKFQLGIPIIVVIQIIISIIIL